MFYYRNGWKGSHYSSGSRCLEYMTNEISEQMEHLCQITEVNNELFLRKIALMDERHDWTRGDTSA